VDGSPRVRVSLLNGFTLEVRDADRCVAVGGLPRSVQRLVAHLSLTGCPARPAIAGQLWPDVPEEHAQGSLRSVLWRLQKAVPGLVEASSGLLRLAADVTVDIHELDYWARQVLDPQGNVDAVATPASALRGELLPGWYDDWVLLERERLRQLRMHALERLAEKLARTGRFGEAVQAAGAAVLVEPLRESAHRMLIHVHLAEGNVIEALREYETFRAILAAELHVSPTPLMEALIEPIRRRARSRRAVNAAAFSG
jgi:DNA-binding SARP family transcriptional activator